MLTDPPRLARLLADQFVKNQIVYDIIDNKIKLKLKFKVIFIFCENLNFDILIRSNVNGNFNSTSHGLN